MTELFINLGDVINDYNWPGLHPLPKSSLLNGFIKGSGFAAMMVIHDDDMKMGVGSAQIGDDSSVAGSIAAKDAVKKVGKTQKDTPATMIIVPPALPLKGGVSWKFT